jgi:hypothetical protein
VNLFLFTAGRKLHRLGLDPETIKELLEEATLDCGRDMKPNEIERAVCNSHPDKLKQRAWRRKWPQRNYEQIEAIALAGVRFAELQTQSPVQLNASENHAEEIIDALFRGDPPICAWRSKDFVLTRLRTERRGVLQSAAVHRSISNAEAKGADSRGKTFI